MWDRERAYEDRGVSRNEQIHLGQLWFMGYEKLAGEIGRSMARNLGGAVPDSLIGFLAEQISESMYGDSDCPDSEIPEWDICGEDSYSQAIEKEIQRAYDVERNKEDE